MNISMLKGKIHRATVKQAELDYAARCVATGDKIIIIAYADMTPEEAKTFEPKVVFVDDENQISRCTNYERHGRLEDM